MRVFLPHAQSNSKNNSVTNSPRDDKRKQQEDGESREVVAKKLRVQQQEQPEAQLKDPMGGGGKLFPVRKEREFLEVRQQNGGDHRDSESTNSSDAAADNQNRIDDAFASTEPSMFAAAPASGSAAGQRQGNLKLPSSDYSKNACGNLKSEFNQDPAGFDEEIGNKISLTSIWDSAAPTSIPFAASKPGNHESEGTLCSRHFPASAAAMPLLIKSIEEDNDPATISKADNVTDDQLSQYSQLLRTSHKPSLEIIPMAGDGNCLFRAISLQVYGSSDMHSTVRAQCLDFMEVEELHFKDFVAEPYREYIARKRMDGVHGNHAEIQAASELYNRRIEVFVPPNVEPMNIFQQEEVKASKSDESKSSETSDNHPIRLLYMDGNHYDALINPLVPTAGLGLGLPGLEPGLADKLQLDQAKRESNQTIQNNMERKMQLVMEESKRAQDEKDEDELRRVLRESCVDVVGGTTENEEVEDSFMKKSMYLSELDAADYDLEQAVLASSFESHRKMEQELKPASRRGDIAGRRGRYSSSPRSSSSSPVYRVTAAAAAASSSTAQMNASSGFTTLSTPYDSSYPVRSVEASIANAAAASSVASLPRARSSSPPFNYCNTAAAAVAQKSSDEYPASVQELVMNGFQLSQVLHAYDLIGDNFDDLLSFLLSSVS